MSETKNILEVKDLRVSYHTYAGEVQSVRGGSFELETGKRWQLWVSPAAGNPLPPSPLWG